MYKGIQNVSEIKSTISPFRVQFYRPNFDINISEYFSNEKDAIARAKELQKKYPSDLRLGMDNPDNQLKEYLKKLRKGSTINRTQLQKTYYGSTSQNNNDVGRVGEVLKEFEDRNFKILKDPRKKTVKKVLTPEETTALNNKYSKEYGGLKGKELYNALTADGKRKLIGNFLLRARNPETRATVGQGGGSGARNIVIDQLKKLKNNKLIKDFIKKVSGLSIRQRDDELEKISKKLSPIVKKDLRKSQTAASTIARRIADLAKAFTGDTEYLNIKTKDPVLLEGAKKISNINARNIFKDLGSGFKRRGYENNVEDQLGLKRGTLQQKRQNFRYHLRKLGIKTPSIDEVTSVASGAKSGSGGYTTFIQGIPHRMNTRDKTIVDRLLIATEQELQNLDPNSSTYDVDRELIKDEYNKVAKEFATQMNKGNKLGALPVRALELSFDNPLKSVSRYGALKKKYPNVISNIDNVYKKYNYSFKVPKDIKTVFEIDEVIKNPAFRKKILNLAKKGPRYLTMLGGTFLGATALNSVFKGGTATAAEIQRDAQGNVIQPQAVERPQVIEKPETIQYNRETGSFLNTATEDKTDQNQLLQWGQENPLTAVAGTSVALSAQEIPRAYKMRRGVGDTGPLPGGKGRIRSSIGIGGALKPVLTTLGTPLVGLGFEGLMAKERLENDETMSDVLMDPFGPAATLAFMEPLSRSSGVVRGAPTGIANYFKNYGDLSNVGQARPGLTSKALRLGLSPRMIAGASRFLGLPGLALTTGLAGYNAYKNYQNEEGMIYDFFNKDE